MLMVYGMMAIGVVGWAGIIAKLALGTPIWPFTVVCTAIFVATYGGSAVLFVLGIIRDRRGGG